LILLKTNFAVGDLQLSLGKEVAFSDRKNAMHFSVSDINICLRVSVNV